MTILDEIVKDKRKRLVVQKEKISVEDMKKKAMECVWQKNSFYEALKKDGLSIIGEFKKASPSMGVIDGKIELTDRIDKYNESVDAISVLTEEDHFRGNADYLIKISNMTTLPIIRKDFIIDEYQIYEAKVIGASCILLIAAILDDEQMKRLYNLAVKLELDVLLEVHTEEEMDRAINLGAKIIGVNNRNLKDFSIDLNNTKRLSEYMDKLLKERKIEKRPIFVSESGVSKDSDIIFLKKCKVDALLIGRAFMENENPEKLAKRWKEVYRYEC